MKFKNYKKFKERNLRIKLENGEFLTRGESFISYFLMLSETYSFYEGKIINQIKRLSQMTDSVSLKRKNALIKELELCDLYKNL